MGRIDHINDGEWADIKRRLRALETRSPTGSTAVTNGRLRIAGQNALIVDGSGKVTGTLAIDGLQVVDGELRINGRLTIIGPMELRGDTDITGDARITGRLDIDGPTRITGNTDITGPLSIEGDTEVTGDMDVRGDIEVLGDGRIRVGSMTLDPNVGNGSIVFANGAQLFTNGDTIQMYKGSSVVQIADDEAKLQLGAKAVRLTPDGTAILNLPVRANTGLPVGTIIADPDGTLRRSDGS